MLRTIALLPAALLSMIACGDDGDTTATDASVDAVRNNPDNPLGLGPAPVGLGTAGDPQAAGRYVLMAKTGITNVTGTAITGGDVAISLAIYVAVYMLVFGAGLRLLLRLIAAGPAVAAEEPSPSARPARPISAATPGPDTTP